MLYLSKLISVTLIVVTTACVLLSLRTTCNPGTTRTTEVHMYWQKSGENFWGSRNQVCPVWNFPPRWQNWIKDQNHSPQTSLRCWTNQHRNPPGMADWKRQAASDLGNSAWLRSYVTLNSPPLLVRLRQSNVQSQISPLPFLLHFSRITRFCVPFCVCIAPWFTS